MNDVSVIELAFALCVGVSLSAACGFRVFVPLLVVSLAVVAGTVVTCGMLPELHPCLKWGIAVVLGGGSAGVVQTATAIVRGGSTAMTVGLVRRLRGR